MKRITLTTLTTLSIALAGCGGGGDGAPEGVGIDADIPTAPVVFSSENSETIVQQALGGDAYATSQPTAGAAAGATISYELPPRSLLALMASLSGDMLESGNMSSPAGISTSFNEACFTGSYSGTASATPNDNVYYDNTTGTLYRLVYADPIYTEESIFFDRCNFVPVDRIEFYGDIKGSASSSGGAQYSAAVWGRTLNVLVETTDVYDLSAITNYSFSTDYDPDQQNIIYSMDYTLSSTVIGGSVTVTTPAPFLVDLSGADPVITAGGLVVEGADGNRITIYVFDANQFYWEAEWDSTNTGPEATGTIWVDASWTPEWATPASLERPWTEWNAAQ